MHAGDAAHLVLPGAVLIDRSLHGGGAIIAEDVAACRLAARDVLQAFVALLALDEVRGREGPAQLLEGHHLVIELGGALERLPRDLVGGLLSHLYLLLLGDAGLAEQVVELVPDALQDVDVRGQRVDERRHQVGVVAELLEVRELLGVDLRHLPHAVQLLGHVVDPLPLHEEALDLGVGRALAEGVVQPRLHVLELVLVLQELLCVVYGLHQLLQGVEGAPRRLHGVVDHHLRP